MDPFPEISIIQQSKIEPQQGFYYEELVRSNFKKVLPKAFYQLESDHEKIAYFKTHDPFVNWDVPHEAPSSVSLTFIYKYRLYSSKFVYDLISRWLVPGKGLNISRYYGTDFKFNQDPEQKYILIEVLLDLENEADLSIIQKTLPNLRREVQLGVSSADQGVRILEVKGMNIDDKRSQIQDMMLSLINRKPKHFDRELLIEMQHFFIFAQEGFKRGRSTRYLTRLICWHHLFRKLLSHSNHSSSKRLFRIKLMRTTLSSSQEEKKVLGVLVAVSYLRENESFGKRQILNALLACNSEVKWVEGSYVSYRKREWGASLMYLEVYKSDESEFLSQDLMRLKNRLPEELKDRVEQLMHPVFMPRNEEEIMRNILNLNKQLKSPEDIPQIIIQFDKQDENHIVFVVILLRVVQSSEESIQELCENLNFKYELIPDRTKIVGRLKKGFSKEANVFYVRLDKQTFLRKDHSLDLYRARQAVLNELYRLFSDVRDYNGGMIAKETEIFNKFKNHMVKTGPYNEVHLENYFYSLSPVIVRSMVSVHLLETSFQLFIDLLEEEKPLSEGYVLRFSHHSHYIFSNIASKDSSFQNQIQETLASLKLSRFQLITSFLQVEDTFYLGLVFQSDRLEERKRFCDVVRKTLEAWEKKPLSVSSPY